MPVIDLTMFKPNDWVTVLYEQNGEAHIHGGFFVAMDETGVMTRAKKDRNQGFTFIPGSKVLKVSGPAS